VPPLGQEDEGNDSGDDEDDFRGRSQVAAASARDRCCPAVTNGSPPGRRSGIGTQALRGSTKYFVVSASRQGDKRRNGSALSVHTRTVLT
jgi:hypothetical protein